MNQNTENYYYYNIIQHNMTECLLLFVNRATADYVLLIKQQTQLYCTKRNYIPLIFCQLILIHVILVQN